jgi:hypothetical protein
MIKKFVLAAILVAFSFDLGAKTYELTSPDGKNVISVKYDASGLTYSLAYDGVLLASVLSSKPHNEIEENLTSKSGFIGVNGYFKILPTGQSRHSLEIYEITSSGPKVVSKGDKKVEYTENNFDIRYIPYDDLPVFYGKNNSEVLEWLYNN